MTLFPSSIKGLVGLWEEQLPFLFSLSWDPEAFYDGSPHLGGGVLIPPYCSSNERCKPESMRGTMSPLGGNPLTLPVR
ncbi:hypothetical protein J5U23_01854 [Saccharolobus shibatae B12]|uniref:Uncharacterized protein n=1 Tax=Saccharolobus shibatae (strain ATCC 51178 / DSM 5389 / JCM 8931 / NBRC 15437 / B12) TaxID=523848 RepID=A0A8F5BPB2_SACSH|nr:hypothetical protein J5U23_01854 [Saccharolobus shibatae B12]